MFRAALFAAAVAYSLPLAAAPLDSRAFLAGAQSGSLASPHGLDDAPAVKRLCEGIADLHLPPAEGEERPEAVVRAQHAVYRLQIPPAGFSLRSDSEALSVDMRKLLQTFDGQVSITALASADSTFSVAPEVVRGVKAAAKAKRVGLELTFTLEGTESGVPVCFARSGGKARLLRVQPMSYALVDTDSGAELARLRTTAWAELSAWVSPGAATVQVQATSGERTLTAVQDELRTSDLESCLGGLLETPTATGVVSFAGFVTKRAGLGDVRVQVDALNDPKALRCVQDKVEALAMPGVALGAPVSVQVSVQRPEDQGPQPLLLD